MTRVVLKGEFSGTRQELAESLARYRQALEDHKTTVGVPKPWPEHEILFELVKDDKDDFEIEAVVEQQKQSREQQLLATIATLTARVEALEKGNPVEVRE